MYRSLFHTFRNYWRDYGGFHDWLRSPFLHLSLLVTILYQYGVVKFDWASTATSSLPTILGFSLAAYTITFTLMGSALHRALSSALDNEGRPLVNVVNATFFHVILFQSLALMNALLTRGDFFWTALGGKIGIEDAKTISLGVIYHGGNALGCFLSIYSLFLLFSVGLGMFRLGRLTSKATVPVPANSNQNEFVSGSANANMINSWRFTVVKLVAKSLRLYK